MNGPFSVGAVTNLTTSASAVTTSAASAPKTVLVSATAAAYVALVQGGTVADNTAMVLPAGGTIFLTLSAGDKISALQVTAAGVVSVTDVKFAAWN
jgi:hypothetical protein